LQNLLGVRKPIGCKWVFKNYRTDGFVERYKAQLVAKGYSWVEGIDYDKTFSLVAKLTSIMLLLALVATYEWEIEQMDMKPTFFRGELNKILCNSKKDLRLVGEKAWCTS
jgi:hypothetical protein